MKNGVSAAPRSNLRGDPFAAFDRLPAALRGVLHEAVVKWDPRQSRWEINRAMRAGLSEAEAVAEEIRAIHEAERAEMHRFAHHWPARFGRYPHLAAGATVQRYGRRA